jgi:hypothetical protein
MLRRSFNACLICHNIFKFCWFKSNYGFKNQIGLWNKYRELKLTARVKEAGARDRKWGRSKVGGLLWRSSLYGDVVTVVF